MHIIILVYEIKSFRLSHLFPCCIDLPTTQAAIGPRPFESNMPKNCRFALGVRSGKEFHPILEGELSGKWEEKRTYLTQSLEIWS